MATHKPSKLLPLTSQTKLTLTLTLILNPKSKLTLEGATNPIKATINCNICAHIVDTHNNDFC